jgi:cell wall-associated NlpC family hydrolase
VIKPTNTSLVLLLGAISTGCVSLRSDPYTPLASRDLLYAPSGAQAGGRFLLGLAEPRRRVPVNEPSVLLADGKRTTQRSWGEQGKQYSQGPIRVSDRHAERQRLADAALSLVGSQEIVVGGQSFPKDCSGFVRAVYASRGIDVYRTRRIHRSDNGVRIIHKFSGDRDGLHRRVFPQIGDLVFFDRTWDRNGNGRDVDDQLTHVGIVEHVDDDGTVHFVHRITGGIVRQRMNLLYPGKHASKGKVLNDWLKRGGRDRLAGKLFAGFGTVVR